MGIRIIFIGATAEERLRNRDNFLKNRAAKQEAFENSPSIQAARTLPGYTAHKRAMRNDDGVSFRIETAEETVAGGYKGACLLG